MSTITQGRVEFGTARDRVRARVLAEEQERVAYAGRKESPDVARLIGFAMLLTAAALVVIGAAG
jgi:hypothetical protein